MQLVFTAACLSAALTRAHSGALVSVNSTGSCDCKAFQRSRIHWRVENKNKMIATEIINAKLASNNYLPYHWDASGFATYDVQQSTCLNTPGYQQLNDSFPVTFFGNLAVVDSMMEDVVNKTLVMIGEQTGDQSSCLQHYAKSVKIIEMNEDKCDYLRRRGLDVQCTKLDEANADVVLPVADVYNWWTFPRGYLKMAQMIHQRLLKVGRTAVLYIDFSPSTHEVVAHDMAHVCGEFQEYFRRERVSMRRIILPRHPTYVPNSTDAQVVKQVMRYVGPYINQRFVWYQMRVIAGVDAGADASSKKS